MAFMGQILKPVQDLCRAMLAGKDRKDLPKAEEWEAWYQVSLAFEFWLTLVDFVGL